MNNTEKAKSKMWRVMSYAKFSIGERITMTFTLPKLLSEGGRTFSWGTLENKL